MGGKSEVALGKECRTGQAQHVLQGRHVDVGGFAHSVCRVALHSLGRSGGDRVQKRLCRRDCAREVREDAEGWRKAHDLFIYLVDTGVRLSEALDIEWADINMKERLIENYAKKVDGWAFLPISDRVFEMLQRRHNQPRPFHQMDRAVKNLRSAITASTDNSRRVLAQKGKATVHSLRDTYATRMLNEGLSLGEVGYLLAHKSLTTTQKYARYENVRVAEKARKALRK